MTTASEAARSPEAPWRRLHPASVVVNLVPRSWRLIRSLWPLFLAMLYGNRASGEAFLDVGMVGLFLALTIGGTVLHWLTLRYRVQDGRLEIRSGLANRQVRVISPDRVQNIERVQNVFHRMSGLVEVRIETASGTEVEGLLSALSDADAAELIEALGRARREPTEEVEAPAIIENSLGDLVRFGLTATRVGAAVVLIGVALEGLQRVDPTGLPRMFGQLGGLGILAIVVAALTGTWLVGTVTATVRHYGFRLLQVGRGLVAEEGLFTRRRVELPLGKVQVVTVSEPLLRRLVGFSSIHIETAAAREGGGGTQRAEAMVPVVERPAVQRVVRAAIPALDLDLHGAVLRPPHPRALTRSLFRATIRGLLLSGLISWWFWPWGLLSVALVPLSLFTAWQDHRHQGWLLTDQVLVARKGWLSRRTRVVARSKLQALDVRQGPFLRRYGLGELVARVAGDAVVLPVLDWDEALRLELDLVAGWVAPSRPSIPSPPTTEVASPPPGEERPDRPVDGDPMA